MTTPAAEMKTREIMQVTIPPTAPPIPVWMTVVRRKPGQIQRQTPGTTG